MRAAISRLDTAQLDTRVVLDKEAERPLGGEEDERLLLGVLGAPGVLRVGGEVDEVDVAVRRHALDLRLAIARVDGQVILVTGGGTGLGRATALSLGAGPHFCLGASRARAELQEAFAFLAPRMRQLSLDGEPVYDTPLGVYGLRELPVSFARA